MAREGHLGRQVGVGCRAAERLGRERGQRRELAQQPRVDAHRELGRWVGWRRGLGRAAQARECRRAPGGFLRAARAGTLASQRSPARVQRISTPACLQRSARAGLLSGRLRKRPAHTGNRSCRMLLAASMDAGARQEKHSWGDIAGTGSRGAVRVRPKAYLGILGRNGDRGRGLVLHDLHQAAQARAVLALARQAAQHVDLLGHLAAVACARRPALGAPAQHEAVRSAHAACAHSYSATTAAALYEVIIPKHPNMQATLTLSICYTAAG